MPSTSDAPPTPSAALPLRWLETYGDSLYGYAIKRLRRPELAEDLVQETLLAAVQSLGSFRQQANVGTWLSSILRNKIADHLRDRYRNEPAESLDEETFFDQRGNWRNKSSAWDGDPHQLAELEEFRAVINACIAKLPTRMSHLFLSRVGDGISAVQLCEELQITQDNAWMLLHRARLRLRECLTTNWFGNSRKGSNRRK